jgi:hypothetical protein
MRQLELFTRAQLATMRDRTRRRNYSAAAEGFRDTHQRHRAWGLTQRHNRKLSRLYGTTANASAELRRRADELTSPSAPTRTAEPTAFEPTASEPVAPGQVVAKATGSEPVGSRRLMPDRGHDAARGRDPSRPSRPGKHRGRATKGNAPISSMPPSRNRARTCRKSCTKTPGPGRRKECRPPAGNTDPPDGSVPAKRLPPTGPAVISSATRRIPRSARESHCHRQQRLDRAGPALPGPDPLS